LDDELNRALLECMRVFEELRGLEVRVCYKPLREGVLGQTRVKKQVLSVGGKRRLVWSPVIEVSTTIRMLGDPRRRRDLLMYVLVHELVHISRSHLNRPRSKEHEDDFEQEVIERLRTLQKLLK